VSRLASLLRVEGIDAGLAGRLAAYGDLLLSENRSFNLTGAKTESELVPHIVDSLTLVPYIRGALVDVGSGGGLPAIPAAMAAGVEVTLVEATAKKARFLADALKTLGHPGRVIADRAELAGRQAALRDHFGFGSIRAVGGITTSAELIMCFLEPGGLALLQRGRTDQAEREAIADAALVLGGKLQGVEIVARDRCICLVRKESSTPERFPRRPGIPSKKPLCMKPGATRDSLVQGR
jgi:16S rRNA (guanine527-N7)-methyltransferase